MRLEFQVAVDSNGNYWSTDTIDFYVIAGDEMEFAEFTVYSPEYPQNYALDYAVVSRIHAGTYIARAQSEFCVIVPWQPKALLSQYITSTNECIEVNIHLTCLLGGH